jgi:hypothetical protein
MDTKRHPESEFNFLTYRLLGEKYRFTDFSVVLTSDDNAFNFARQNRKVLFGDAPIVFCGVNYLENPEDMAAENITGVLESYDIAATVQAAARLVPAARRRSPESRRRSRRASVPPAWAQGGRMALSIVLPAT